MKLSLPMFTPGETVTIYSDDTKLNGSMKQTKLNRKQEMNITIPYNGGIVIQTQQNN